MTSVLSPLVESVFPRDVRHSAARLGTICLILAVTVAFFFPVAVRAGTETPAARWTTVAALVLAGAAMRWSAGQLGVVGAGIVALVVGAVLAPAHWLMLVAGGCCLYLATALVPRPAWTLRDEDREPRLEGTQEMVESLAMALVLALVVREFGFEAFKIPTGSMEPTILGDGRDRKGDRLLAFKPVGYRRWDIVVFKFPLFRNTNYIKRLIGLPGERMELRSGDVYVNDRIASKPDDVQEVMWRKVFTPKSDAAWISDFDPDPQGAWKLRTGLAEVEAKGDTVAWLQSRFGFEEDQRISFDVEVAPGTSAGQILVSLEGGKRGCELTLDATSAKVTGPGLDAGIDGMTLAALGTKFRLGFSMSDRIARVYVDGRQIAAFAHDDTESEGLDRGRVRIGARNLSAVVRNVVGENDVQYGNSGTQSWDIPADGYVMLGDNTWSSRDSRLWTANIVRLKDGREFVSPTTARVTEEREETVFRPRPDGGVDFIDSYGISHAFAGSEVAEIRRDVSQPFARTGDLVGRAFLIFFPLSSLGEFRPRLLR